MRRLRLDGNKPGRPVLGSLPKVSGAPHELIAAVASAAGAAGAEAPYADLMGLSGAAFMLRVGAGGFSHADASSGRDRLLRGALADLGFPRAQVVSSPTLPPPELAEELTAGRPAVAQGCFPEAPWRAGIVTGLLPDGLWTILDCAGRLHSLAPRSDLLVLLGPHEPGSGASSVPALLWRCLDAWEGADGDEGAGAWRHWLGALDAWPDAAGEALTAVVAAHEFVYEVLLDARGAAASWLAELSAEGDEVSADWLARAAAGLSDLAELLDSRHPPVHHPDVVRALADPGWRAGWAALLSEAAERDLSAKHDLARALEADYPPGEE